MYESLSIAVPLTANSLLSAGAVHDKVTLGRIYPVSLSTPLVWIGGSALLLAFVQPSATWRQLSLWLVGP